MKTRGAKVLLSLLAIAAVGFATANAYTFEVVNRSPFGILNLSQLVIKPTTSTTSMTLSEYLLQINGTQGQINVHQICDENGSNCIDIKDIGSGGGGNGVQILTGNEGYICTQSGDNLVCNTTGSTSLPDDFITGIDEKLCRKSGNKLVCNRKFGDGHIKFYNGTNNEAIVRKDSENLGNDVPLDGEGIYTVYLPVPVISGTNQYICVKSGEDTICGTAKLGSMNPGKYCYFTGDSITCTEDGPGNANITLQVKSGDNEIIRSGTFNVNATTDDAITIPGGGGGTPGPKGDTGAAGAHITNAHIEGNNIVFEMSDGIDPIVLTDAIINLKGETGADGATGPYITEGTYDSQNHIVNFTLSDGSPLPVSNIFIEGPQGDTGATGLGIHHIDTDKVDRVTTVTIIGTDESTLASFEILDGQDGNGGSGINALGESGQRCIWQCNRSIGIDRACNKLPDEEKGACDQERISYLNNGCTNENPNQGCIDTINNIRSVHEGWVDFIEGQNNCGVVCNQQKPSCEGECEGSGLTVSGVLAGGYCRFVTPQLLELRSGDNKFQQMVELMQNITDIDDGRIECTYNGGGGSNNESTGVSVSVTGTASTYCSSEDGETLVCNNIIPTGPNAPISDGIRSYTTGTSQWIEGGGSSTILTTIFPNEANYNVSIGSNSFVEGYKLNVNGIVNFEQAGNASAKFTSNRISLFGAKNFTLQNMFFHKNSDNSVGTAIHKTIPGLSVNGAIAAGNQNNYIYMYAGTGVIGTGGRVGNHYEIMGNNQLSIGTKDGAFAYFTTKNITYKNYIDGYTPEPTFVSSTSINTPVSNQVSHSISPDPLDITYDQVYSALMVGINTDQPRATLDVNGTVKIGANCVAQNTACDENNVGTIMYFQASSQAGVGRLAICRDTANGGHIRYDLITGMTGFTLSQLGYQQDYCNIPFASEALPNTLVPIIQ